ncbi:MAG: hypothetical protein ACLP01_06520 [Solirubrobacteraceae bacterium]
MLTASGPRTPNATFRRSCAGHVGSLDRCAGRCANLPGSWEGASGCLAGTASIGTVDLVSFANSGLVAAAEGDGNEAKALEYHKPAYKDPLQAEQTAIRSLTNAKDYGVKFEENMSRAGTDLEAHDCQRVLDDDLDDGGATGTEGRNGDADTQESNALSALEELAK